MHNLSLGFADGFAQSWFSPYSCGGVGCVLSPLEQIKIQMKVRAHKTHTVTHAVLGQVADMALDFFLIWGGLVSDVLLSLLQDHSKRDNHKIFLQMQSGQPWMFTCS